MLGRARELGELRATVEAARAGTSGAVLVRGEAGVGKTALLDALAEEAAAAGLTVLRASGLESEQQVAWSGLADLLRPVVGHLDALPPPQAAALAGALAIGPPVDGDRFAIGAATLGVLAAAAERAPVLAVVDDVQWLDPPSAEAVRFAGRRLAAEGVALVLARRDGEPTARADDGDLDWLASLEVGPLDHEAAVELLRQRAPGPVAPAVARRLVAAAAGNALALVTVPRLLSPDQRVGLAPLPDPLPAPASFEREVAARLAQLPERARRALTVAAAHAGTDAATVARALAQLGLDVGDLAAAEALGVLRLGDGAVAFEHPLLRAAAYQAAAPGERRAAHGALAVALVGPAALEARARHLVSASIGPDEATARVLDEAAEQARSRGALTAAADLASHAALLSPSAPARDRRRVRAAELALLGGATVTAKSLLDAVTVVDDPELRVLEAQVRGRWEVVAGSHRKGIAALVEAGEGSAEVDPAGAALLFVHAAAAALSTGRHHDAGELAGRAVDLAAGHQPLASLAELTLRAARVAAGKVDDGAELVALHERLGDADDLLRAAQPALLAATSALVWLEDFEHAEQVVDAVVASARRVGALEVLASALANRAWVLFRIPRVQAGIASAAEALELAELTNQPSVVTQAKHLLAHLVGFAGRFDDARTLASEVLAATDASTLSPLRYHATLCLAGVELAAGRDAVAVELLESIVDPDPASPYFRNPAAFGGAFSLVEAYLRVGRVDDAKELLARTEEVVAGLDQPWPRGQVLRLHGWLADEYDDCFAEAVAFLSHVSAAEVAARVDWAGRLAGEGRAEEARGQLRRALAIARRTGYHARTATIVARLGALGDPVVASPDALALLSGQELAVATTVAGGASVPEAAAELFLSPQTVERDLAEACRKLGVHGPAALAARLEGASAPPSPAGWRVRLLGAWHVERDGTPVAVPPGRAGTLVQLLAVLGGRLTVDEVVEHLWPEAEAEVGRVRLRNVLARVRRALGDCVERDGDVLALRAGVEVDAASFAAAAGAALAARDAAAADAAVRAYGGELLPDARYEPWAEEPRERLRRRYVDLLDLLADAARAEGRWDDAARHVEAAIDADPHEHDRYVAAAEARLRQGRRSTALRWCRRARDAAADLGVPPPPALAAVEAAALAAGT